MLSSTLSPQGIHPSHPDVTNLEPCFATVLTPAGELCVQALARQDSVMQESATRHLHTGRLLVQLGEIERAIAGAQYDLWASIFGTQARQHVPMYACLAVHASACDLHGRDSTSLSPNPSHICWGPLLPGGVNQISWPICYLGLRISLRT